nr:hypothetical protein [Bacteroides fragilis]
MIKRIKILATGALLMAGLGACSPSGKKTGSETVADTLRTAETVNLLKVSSINSIYPLVSDSRTL